MTPAGRIQAALYGAFGLALPPTPPVPAAPEQFLAISARPAPPAALDPLRIAVTTPKR